MAINRDYIGRTFPAAAPYEVSRVKIVEFADAIGDPNPLYRDRAAAQATLSDIRDAGRNVMLSTKTEISTVDGEHVCTAHSTLVERGGAA